MKHPSGPWCNHFTLSPPPSSPLPLCRGPPSPSGGHETLIPEFERLIRLVVDHSTLEIVLQAKAASLSRLPVRNGALGGCWVPVHLFLDQPKATPLILGVDFLKEQRCVMDYGEDLTQFPMQSDCWWPLFVSSRGLCSMPLYGQHWEPSSREQLTNCLTVQRSIWRFLMAMCIYVSENDGSADEPVSEKPGLLH